jgi:3-hydroxyisobutyrate dehydrogenase-like beta-hydroxyacid dehydrogenase
MKAGFIGTGNMGNPMAKNLLAAGVELVVNDVRQEACANLIEMGATWADTPRQVAEQATVVFTSLPGPRQVDEVALAASGIYAGAKPGTVHVDLSSNSLSAVKRLAVLAAQRNIGFLDAPVSGGTAGAAAGTLSVMVGGEKSSFDAVKPLLEIIGGNIFHLGDVGSGTMLKLTNNMLALGGTLLLQEVMALGAKAGFDPQTLHSVWSVSSGRGQAAAMPNILKRNWENPFFSLALSAKDVGLCLEAARDLEVTMPVAQAVGQWYTRSMVRGRGNLSWFATLKTIEEDAAVDVGTWPEEEAKA